MHCGPIASAAWREAAYVFMRFKFSASIYQSILESLSNFSGPPVPLCPILKTEIILVSYLAAKETF